MCACVQTKMETMEIAAFGSQFPFVVKIISDTKTPPGASCARRCFENRDLIFLEIQGAEIYVNKLSVRSLIQ